MNSFIMLENGTIIPKSRILNIRIEPDYHNGEKHWCTVLYYEDYDSPHGEIFTRYVLFQCKTREECEKRLRTFSTHCLDCDYWNCE